MSNEWQVVAESCGGDPSILRGNGSSFTLAIGTNLCPLPTKKLINWNNEIFVWNQQANMDIELQSTCINGTIQSVL